MSADTNKAPVIIRRKKVVAGGGHHGGAWKVAYADFVTAMMAFFMLMWLLSATTEKQKRGIADYFSPTIPISRVSGGGNGAFGGDSIFSEETLPRNGTGASATRAAAENKARGSTGSDPSAEERAAQDEAFTDLEAKLQGRGGESLVMENAMKHITTRITDEGLVVEVFSLENAPLFEPGTDVATPILRDLAAIISDMSKTVTNQIAVGGHVRAAPLVLAENPVWDLSHARASRMRKLLEGGGIAEARMDRVTGHADRETLTRDPMSVRNDRIEVVLLRDGS
ncbi:flagellar motor protein MotB [Sulfitobacter sp. S190]|uniref:flagellar motor protein MotB n=1 Tax=Sulfitobacter sp. S190 TaxID=2867022 RepID=UPI0021A6BBB7|nr:flagellar motor protein MotB [Sulfitobacter sp. S190]UWR22349.1 chemotaxis protein MotB [Sulfitobacter sp. S190]